MTVRCSVPRKYATRFSLYVHVCCGSGFPLDHEHTFYSVFTEDIPVIIFVSLGSRYDRGDNKKVSTTTSVPLVAFSSPAASQDDHVAAMLSGIIDTRSTSGAEGGGFGSPGPAKPEGIRFREKKQTYGLNSVDYSYTASEEINTRSPVGTKKNRSLPVANTSEIPLTRLFPWLCRARALNR